MFKIKENIYHLFYFHIENKNVKFRNARLLFFRVKLFFYTTLRKDWRGRNRDPKRLKIGVGKIRD